MQVKIYAKKNGLMLGRLVALTPQYYVSKDGKILRKLDEIEALLRNGNFIMKQHVQAKVSYS